MIGTAENYDDVISQLRGIGLLVGHGTEHPALEIGKLTRCRIEDDREKRGWYVLHEVQSKDGRTLLVGSFGRWHGGDNNLHKVSIKGDPLTAEQKSALKSRLAEDRRRAAAARKLEIERAATRAQHTWERCSTSGTCGYLARKQVAGYGVRFTAKGNMVIPMHDASGRIFGLQVIYGDSSAKKRKGRDKDYWPTGLEKKGKFFQLGGSPTWLILIAEGYATAASLHEATGYPIAVAFDAMNLMPVAREIHKRYPWVRILICGDDDRLAKCPNKSCRKIGLVAAGQCDACGTSYLHGNTGADSAAAAALAVGGAWVLPKFGVTDAEETRNYTDFNDLHSGHGLHTVRAQVDSVLSELGWAVAAGSARVETKGEAGQNQPLKGCITVEEACRRYALVYGGGGTLFDRQEHELVPKPDVLDLLEDHGWRDWKRHPGREVVRMSEVGFDPDGSEPNIRCNLWSGWPTQPKEGDPKPLLELAEFLCSGEANHQEITDWVLNWIAYPIQHPGAKMQTALVFHGPQGAGKNMFFEAVMRIYGKYGSIVDQNAIEDKFNEWASKKLFLIADEVVARAELFHTKNKLKALITGDRIRINPKQVSAHDERNHVNIVFLSNETQPLVLDRDDRRYVVVWTPATAANEFYSEIASHIDRGCIEAFHHHLLHRDLGSFKPWSKPPMTKAKADLIQVSLDSVQRFLREWEDGDTEFPFCPCRSMDLYAGYLRWCRANGIFRPRDSGQFLGHIGKLRRWTTGPRKVFADAGYTGEMRSVRVVIPDEIALARVKRQRDEAQQMTRWLTDCILDFAMALEESAHKA